MTDSIISSWVKEKNNPLPQAFRQAVHTILFAISHSRDLYPQMIMKGAILLAIRHNCIRNTKDIDFSTSKMVREFDKDRFLSDLADNLILATEILDYGIDCRIQSSKFKPSSPDATFPTLKIKVGYAYKHERNSHKRLLAGNCSQVVEIDYSFNEATYSMEKIFLENGGTLLTYSATDLIAEKFRAILQQRQRNRTRRQDVYDLYYLFHHRQPFTDEEKSKIFDSLVKKAAARGITVELYSMRDPEIRRKSGKEYDRLQSEIIGELPEFDTAYSYVRSFYENLPWSNIVLL